MRQNIAGGEALASANSAVEPEFGPRHSRRRVGNRPRDHGGGNRSRGVSWEPANGDWSRHVRCSLGPGGCRQELGDGSAGHAHGEDSGQAKVLLIIDEATLTAKISIINGKYCHCCSMRKLRIRGIKKNLSQLQLPRPHTGRNYVPTFGSV